MSFCPSALIPSSATEQCHCPHIYSDNHRPCKRSSNPTRRSACSLSNTEQHVHYPHSLLSRPCPNLLLTHLPCGSSEPCFPPSALLPAFYDATHSDAGTHWRILRRIKIPATYNHGCNRTLPVGQEDIAKKMEAHEPSPRPHKDEPGTGRQRDHALWYQAHVRSDGEPQENQ